MHDPSRPPSPKEPSSVRPHRHREGVSADEGRSGLDLGPMRDPSPTPRRSSTRGSGTENRGLTPVGDPASGSGGSGGSAGRPSASMTAGLPAPGERLDVFEVQEAIGVGGMGAVYRAVDTRLDRLVALKVLPPELASDSENIRRFCQEARAAAQLDHENIARVYSIGQDKGVVFIAFEFIDGTNIRQRVETQGPLSPAETINYSLQIAGALVHAAERGVVHRDIKPSNLIVTPQGRAKLVDMGLARRFERTGTDDGLTQSGMTLGTFDYISPEQARDPRSVDCRSDLYSLGCTMFHMLTGQPPFPGGTVLQKLLSHREEPAPDVRTLNPSVPAELAAVILRLMAKDPERRYASPELLVQDLLVLADSLGLRSVSPEGLIWTEVAPQRPRPAWERHLFWGIPAGLLVLIVGGLIWLGQGTGENDQNPGSRLSLENPASGAGRSKGQGTRTGPPTAPVSDPTTKIVSAAAASPVSSGPIRVGPSQDLAAALREAPDGTTIWLTGDGPYRLSTSGSGGSPLRRSLTLRAAEGARPVLRPGASLAVGPLLHVQGASLTLENITIDLGDGDTGPAIFADKSALTLRKCVIRGRGRPASIELVAPVFSDAGPGRPPEPILIESCHFDRARVAILAHGSVDLGLRDCTFASAQSVVWIDNTLTESIVPARLWLSHISVIAGADPVFRIDGTAARIRVLDSVFAPALDKPPGTLVAVDDPTYLDWSGRENLYGRMGTYLLPTRQGPGLRPTLDFPSWAESGPTPRELGSQAMQEHLWARTDPDLALAGGADPTDAFRLGQAVGSFITPGARRTATGLIPPPETLLARTDRLSIDPAPILPGPTEVPVPPRESGSPSPTRSPSAPPVLSPKNPEEPQARPDNPSPTPMTMTEEPESFLEPMVMPPLEPEAPSPSLPPPATQGGNNASPIAQVPPVPPSSPPSSASEKPEPVKPDQGGAESPKGEPVRTAEAFLERIRLLGPRGGVVTLAADAELTLPGSSLEGSGLLEIVAAPGSTRPLLRFAPRTEEGGPSGDWPALFRLRSGGLKLQGVDVLLADEQAPASGRWAAFALSAGASLELDRATVTIAGPRRSAAIRLSALDAESARGPAASTAASVRLTHSFLRCGDDIVDVSAGRRLDLSMTNVVALALGSLVHGHALPLGLEDVTLEIDLRQINAVAAGGLVRLDSALGEPDLPIAAITARESIFSTGSGGTALIRVDGQHEVDSLADRIRWEGERVAYHKIDVYRRDQSSLPGALPRLLRRTDWEMAVGRQDRLAFHGDVLYKRTVDPALPPWLLSLDDFELDPESPVSYTSPDLARIPAPPGISGVTVRNGPSNLDALRRLIQGFRIN